MTISRRLDPWSNSTIRSVLVCVGGEADVDFLDADEAVRENKLMS